jgi:predicted dehydrogenase
MKKYKIGIIGYGGFGRFLHHWWSRLENIEIAAIADSGEHPLQIENVVVYHNWKKLLEDPLIDIVSIVTPPAMHAEMACAAMRAGKHVLLEKPVAITLEGAKEIFETQKATGKIITVDHMIRYNPIIQSFIKLGHNGRFGRLRHVQVNNYAQDETLPENHWFWKEELSGGILVEHGVHFFDIVSAISGQHYSEVYGTSHKRNKSQRDRVAAMVLYDDGLIASYYHAFSGPGYFEQTTISLVYDLARIEIEGWMPMKGSVKTLVNKEIKEQLKIIPGWSISKTQSLEELNDVSRPEGWGFSDSSSSTQEEPTYFSGTAYNLDEMISGTFEIQKTKGEVYGSCVQSILLDIIEKIENPEHKLTVTLDNGVEALQTAILAS